MERNFNVRPSPIAGQWYPAEPGRLAASVDQYLADAQVPAVDGQILAVVAPHAGYLFSGPVAGYAFGVLRGLEPEMVAVVSPMHYPYDQELLTSAHSAYQTPLGCIAIDRQAVETLAQNLLEASGVALSPVCNDPEHSLEIELPFLQRALAAEFSLLPVMVRDQSMTVARGLGTALAKTLAGRNAIMVASTDLSHFYPQKMAVALDSEVLQQLQALAPEGVYQVEEQGKGFACGRGALAAVMWAAKALGADAVKVLRHGTSGDIFGDYLQVVGYAAAVITRRTPAELSS